MMNQIKKFFKEEQGQGMTEYGLILGFIAIAAVGVTTVFGDTFKDKFTSIKDAITGTSTTPPAGS